MQKDRIGFVIDPVIVYCFDLYSLLEFRTETEDKHELKRDIAYFGTSFEVSLIFVFRHIYDIKGKSLSPRAIF